jgi:hypothetical protein
LVDFSSVVKPLSEFVGDAEFILEMFQSILFELGSRLVEKMKCNSDVPTALRILWDVLLRWWISKGWGIGKPPLVRVGLLDFRDLYEVQELAAPVIEKRTRKVKKKFEREFEAKEEDGDFTQKEWRKYKIQHAKDLFKELEKTKLKTRNEVAREELVQDKGSAKLAPGTISYRVLIALCYLAVNQFQECMIPSDFVRAFAEGVLPTSGLMALLPSWMRTEFIKRKLTTWYFLEHDLEGEVIHISKDAQFLHSTFLKFIPTLRDPAEISNPCLLGYRLSRELALTPKFSSYVVRVIRLAQEKNMFQKWIAESVLASILLTLQLFYGLDNKIYRGKENINVEGIQTSEEWQAVRPRRTEISSEHLMKGYSPQFMTPREMEDSLACQIGQIGAGHCLGKIRQLQFEELEGRFQDLWAGDPRSIKPSSSVQIVEAPSVLETGLLDRTEITSIPPWKRVVVPLTENKEDVLNPEMEEVLDLLCNFVRVSNNNNALTRYALMIQWRIIAFEFDKLQRQAFHEQDIKE